MTPHPQTDDPRGHRFDLAEALEGGSSAAVALALARCRTAGVSVPDDLRQRANPLLPSAIPAVFAEIGRWAAAARSLGRRWSETDDPWEADELVRTLVELRTDAEGLLAVLGEELRPAVAAFDQELKAEEGLVSTLAVGGWLEGYRQAVPGVSGWWLNPTAEPPELPTAGFLAVTREVAAAKRLLPQPAGKQLAGDDSDARPEPRVVTFRWRSPDGRGEARLNLPDTPSTAAESVRRPLTLFRDGLPLTGTVVRLGGVSGTTGADGRVTVTLAELRANWDGRLFVGTPPERWPLEVPPTE